MRNIKLTVAYDGTNYHGFQEQRGSGLATVQEVLEACLERFTGRRTQIVGAGRTDSGVHAKGQVVNFDAAGWPIPAGRIPLALNGSLPDDIKIIDAVEAPRDFHARFDARAKIYRYSIWNARIPSPFHRLYSTFWPVPLDDEAMAAAAGLLVGRHDFKCFQAAGSTVRDTVREIYQAEVEREGAMLHFVFRGSGFLYNMVRIISGTLVRVGMGKAEPDMVSRALASRLRIAAGPTLPPHGLCLEAVEY
ncbi:MAG: tRNA pseudouridine(38-40) synthase TruA [Firmicutes bacterium]|nr:tRNA pseudouridine(38-40) synthase TruA [Bacillota bacterium]